MDKDNKLENAIIMAFNECTDDTPPKVRELILDAMHELGYQKRLAMSQIGG